MGAYMRYAMTSRELKALEAHLGAAGYCWLTNFLHFEVGKGGSGGNGDDEGRGVAESEAIRSTMVYNVLRDSRCALRNC